MVCNDCSNSRAIYIETNLDTFMGTTVYHSENAADLKKRLENDHLSCFPRIGAVKINNLKVKCNGRSYILADSVHIHTVFKDVKGGWDLLVDAEPAAKKIKISAGEQAAAAPGQERGIVAKDVPHYDVGDDVMDATNDGNLGSENDDMESSDDEDGESDSDASSYSSEDEEEGGGRNEQNAGSRSPKSIDTQTPVEDLVVPDSPST